MQPSYEWLYLPLRSKELESTSDVVLALFKNKCFKIYAYLFHFCPFFKKNVEFDKLTAGHFKIVHLRQQTTRLLLAAFPQDMRPKHKLR